MKTPLTVVQYPATVAPLLYFTVLSGGFYSLFTALGGGSLTDRSAGDSYAYLGILTITYGFVIYDVLAAQRSALRILSEAPAILLLILSAMTSYIVAGAAPISILRFSLYLLTITTALALSARYSFDATCEAFFIAGATVLLVHFAFYPYLSAIINYDPGGRATLLGTAAYGGFFPHKSSAAEMFSLFLMICIARARNAPEPRKRRIAIIFACAALIAIVMSGAVGPTLSIVVSLATSFLIARVLRGDINTAILLTCGLVIALLAIGYLGIGFLLSSVNRSNDFTGRSELYELWPLFFFDRPLFGYGFNGFFNNAPGGPWQRLSALVAAEATYETFESTYLDMLIQFGTIGTGVFLAILYSATKTSIAVAQNAQLVFRYAPLNIMVWVIISSIEDSGLLLQNFIVGVLIFWVYFGCGLTRFRRAKGIGLATQLAKPKYH